MHVVSLRGGARRLTLRRARVVKSDEVGASGARVRRYRGLSHLERDFDTALLHWPAGNEQRWADCREVLEVIALAIRKDTNTTRPDGLVQRVLSRLRADGHVRPAQMLLDSS
jgi:hypothetical protein